MKSAGQQVPQQYGGAQGPYGQGQQAYGGYGPGYQQPQGPSFQPVGLGGRNRVSSSPNINLNGNLDADQMGPLMWGQTGMQLVDALADIHIADLNARLASEAMGHQYNIAIEYYDTQEKIAEFNKDVEIRKLGVQEKQLEVLGDAHTKQADLELKLAQLSSNTEQRLANIEQKGKTERTKILAMTDAFSRRSWDMGMPVS